MSNITYEHIYRMKMPIHRKQANRMISAMLEDIKCIEDISVNIVCEDDPDSLVDVLMFKSFANIDSFMKIIAQKYSLKVYKTLKTTIIIEEEAKELA